MIFGGVAVIASYLCLTDLGTAPLQGTDEGLYAVAARNAVLYDRWLVPSHQITARPGEPWSTFIKMPPLFTWLSAISQSIFGVSAFAARLPSALAGIGTTLLLVWWGSRQYSRAAGILSGVVWLTIPYVLSGTNAIRQATTDSLFVFLGTAYVFATWAGFHEDNRNARTIAGVLGGLLLLTKGLGAGIFALVVLPLVGWNWRRAVCTRFVAGSAVGVGLFGAWLLPIYLRFGDRVIEEVVLYQVVSRVSGNLASNPGILPFMNFPYIQSAPTHLGPWLFVLVTAGIATLWQARTSPNWQRLFVCWWGGFVFVFFIVTGNHPWYLLVAYPAAALLAGEWVARSLRGERIAGIAVGSGLILSLLFAPRSLSPLAIPDIRLWGLQPGAGIPFVLAIVAVLALLTLAQVRETPDESRILARVAVAAILLTTVLATPTVININSEAERQAIGESVPADQEVYVIYTDRSKIWRPLTVEFYAPETSRFTVVSSKSDVPAGAPILQIRSPGDGIKLSV
jgi:4-amino-4-deoxy-L-arabinose transferase-like glycosyltransferase